MFDVANFSDVKEVPTTNPFHIKTCEAMSILEVEYRMKKLTGNQAAIDRVLDSDTLKNEYEFIYDRYGQTGLDTFKNGIARFINCRVVASTMTLPGQTKHTPFLCKNPACPRCSVYRARYERVKYPANTVAITMVKDQRIASGVCAEINALMLTMDVDWLFCVYTPFHNGTFMIRLINIRLAEMNPLVGDNPVKKFYAEFIEAFEMFETVTIISDPDEMEVRYATESGIEFTSTHLYICRPNGSSGEGTREGGKKKGWEYNHEIGKAFYLSVNDRKKKQDEENGVLDNANVPAVNVADVPYEVVEEAVEEAVENACEPGELAVISTDKLEPAKHVSVEMMHDIRDRLTQQGYSQPEMFVSLKITKEEFDKYSNTIGLGTSNIPENLMEIDFTPEMITMSGVNGLRGRLEIIRNQAKYKAQQVMKKAVTKKEFAEQIAKALKRIE